MRLVVFNDEEPNVAITFEHLTPQTLTWHGACTNCGHTLQCDTIDDAIAAGQTHVDTCIPN